jgi:hypothetical protein
MAGDLELVLLSDGAAKIDRPFGVTQASILIGGHFP